MGRLGRAKCTIDSISAQNQPGRKRMYHYIRDAMSLLSEHIHVQCKKCKWAPITAFQCLRLNEVPFSQSINYRFISNSTVYKRTYAVSSVWINCSSDLKDSANSRPSVSNFGYFLDHWLIYYHRRAEQFWKKNIIIMKNFCLKMFSTFPNTKLPIELMIILADVLSDQRDLRPLDLRYETGVFFVWNIFL